MVEYSYSVIFDPDGVNENVTNDIEVLEIVEVGSGEVNRATIRLNANRGKYLTNVPWTTPIPDQFNRFKVTITDEEANTLVRIYEVDTIVPIQNSQEGTAVEFECLGLEHHLMKIQFGKQFRFENAFETARDVIDFYNENRVPAATQPLVIDYTEPSTNGGTGFNDFPKWNSNFYPFGNRAITCYDALTEMVRSGGGPIPAGGLGDFFEVFFKQNPSDNNEIIFKAFSSGNKGTLVTIDNALDVNVAENEGGIEAFTGNLVKVEGSENGSLPPEYSTFVGKQEVYQLFPNWIDPAISLQDYPLGAIVLFNGQIYSSDIDDNSSTPGTNWTAISLATFLGPGNYSIWTNGLQNASKNSGSNPSPSIFGAVADFNQSGCWDSNLVVADEVNWQFPVQLRIRGTSDIDVNYLYGSATSGTYRGQWFLVDLALGALQAPFNLNGGVDRFGNAYADHFVRRNFSSFTGAEEYKNWDVVGPLDNGGLVRLTQNGDLAAVVGEGLIYKYFGGVWTKLTDLPGLPALEQPRLNHCFHTYQSIGNVDGFNDIPRGGGNYKDLSATQTVYRYKATTFQQIITAFLTGPEYYRAGAWWCQRFPFPYSTHNTVPTLGSLYGNNPTKKDPVTIDSKNMHFTRSGLNGFNNVEAEDFGPINSVNFFIKHNWFINMTISGDKTIFAGDFKYRCTLYDTAGNAVVSDFNVPFNDVWAPISLSIDSFKAYRARTNVGLGNIKSTLIPLGIEVLNRFDWENICMVGVQWQEPYDDQGRYSPEGTRVINGSLTQNSIEFVQGGGLENYTQVQLEIDAFHFGKTMMSVSPPISTGRVIEPPTKFIPWIDNKYQLDQLRDAELEIHEFRQNRWNVATEGRLDVDFGDFFFLQDDYLVNRADKGATPPDGNDGVANTVKLVAKKITHRIDKPATGIGGFITKIEGAKRFEGAPDN